MLLAGDIGGTKTDLAVFQFRGDPWVPIHLIVEPVALLGAALHGLDIADSPGRVGA